VGENSALRHGMERVQCMRNRTARSTLSEQQRVRSTERARRHPPAQEGFRRSLRRGVPRCELYERAALLVRTAMIAPRNRVLRCEIDRRPPCIPHFEGRSGAPDRRGTRPVEQRRGHLDPGRPSPHILGSEDAWLARRMWKDLAPRGTERRTVLFARIIPVLALAALTVLSGTWGVPPTTRASGSPMAGPSHLAFTLRAPRPLASIDNISEDGVSPTLVGLSWTRTTDSCFKSYDLEWSTNGSSGPWSSLLTIPSAGTTDDIELFASSSPTPTVWYQIVDSDCLGNATSNQLQVTFPPVANLTYTEAAANSVALSWSNSANYSGLITFDGYELYESVNGGSFYSVTTIHSESSPSYNLSGLSSSTNYSFYVLTFDSCAGCSAGWGSDSNHVSFRTPNPFIATASASRSSADVGQTVQFTCGVTGGMGPYSYSWAFGDGSTGSGQNASHVYSTPGTEAASCSVADSTGAKASAPVTITVSPAPTVTARVDHLAVAPGSPLTFSATAAGGPGTFLSYAWSFGDNGVGSESTILHTYVGAGQFHATVVVTDGNGDTASSSVTVNVSDLTVTASVDSPFGVPGTEFLFSASANGGGGAPYSFLWTFGDDSTGSGDTAAHSFSSVGNYTVAVTATDALGVSSRISLPPVRVVAPLTAAISLSSSNPFPGESVTLTAKIVGGSGSATCTWNFGDSSSAAGCTVAHAWSSTGSYEVRLTVRDPATGNLSTQREVEVSTSLSSELGPSVGGFPVLFIGLIAALVVLILIQVIRKRVGRVRSPPPIPPP
jgi:hypothetical protein